MRKSGSPGMSVVAKTRYWGQKEAEVALHELAASEGSLVDFARRWGIHPNRLRRWQHRLQHASSIESAPLAPVFRPVEVVAEETLAASSGVELLVGNGHRVALRRGFDQQVLQELLDALGRSSC